MSLVSRPHLSLPAGSPNGISASPESLHAAREELRLLVVDGSALTSDERLRLWPRDCEVRDWYVHAADHGVALVVLRTRGTVELYSTRQDRQLAYSQPLMAFAQRGKSCVELSRVRVVPRRGVDVARRLFTLAAGIGMTRGKAKVILARIEAASALAGKAGCLSPTVDSLLRTAIQVGHRVDDEALMGHPRASESLREVADIGAMRILEEELLNWKAQQTQLHRSLSLTENLVRQQVRATASSQNQIFPEEDEAPSGVRIRVAQDLGQLLEVTSVALEATTT